MAAWIGIGVLCAFAAAVYFTARRGGITSERLTAEEKINAAVEKAVLARQRLRDDAGFAKRLRARFTR